MIDYAPKMIMKQKIGFDDPLIAHGVAISELLKKYNISFSNADEFQRYEEEKRNLAKYGQKPRLDIFETNEYTHPSTWAHTDVKEGVINKRPPEFTDYSLSVEPHEIVHNFYPNLRNEDYVTNIGKGPLFPYIRNSFRIYKN